MKTTILIALVTGVVVAFAACGQTASNGNSMSNNAMKMNSNSSMNTMNNNSMPMNANMSMDDSEMKSSPNAASQPYDLQFIDTMTAHHMSAIDMAKIALRKSQNPELKTFAQKIIDDQQKEIGRMKDFREKWFAGKPMAMNMEMPGMMDSMKMMMGDGMKKLEAMSGKEFDSMFLDMMTAHHKGAVTMAKEALTKAEHAEIKTLANEIISAQQAEIKMMADWKAKWAN